jgi:crossover junction endodeoxyribonuclease RuvC
MLKLGRAQGVAMAAALSRDKEVFEYAPTRIKQAITGSGSASKEQVAAIIKRILKLEYVPRRLDATDGMAVAMCHYYTARTPISQAMGTARVKGLGGGKKAAKGSSSWEAFIKQNPEREIK